MVEKSIISKKTKHYSKLSNLDNDFKKFLWDSVMCGGLKILHVDGGLRALPISQPKLAKRFNCSQTPIFKLLKQLTAEGLIYTKYFREKPRWGECHIVVLTRKGEEVLREMFGKPQISEDKKISAEKNSKEKVNNINNQEINNFNNYKSIPGGFSGGFKRYNESLCARGWKIYEEIFGREQVTKGKMAWIHAAINEIAEKFRLKATEAKLDAFKAFLKHQRLNLKKHVFFVILKLKNIRLYFSMLSAKITKNTYEFKNKTQAQIDKITTAAVNTWEDLKARYGLKEVNRPAPDPKYDSQPQTESTPPDAGKSQGLSLDEIKKLWINKMSSSSTPHLSDGAAAGQICNPTANRSKSVFNNRLTVSEAFEKLKNLKNKKGLSPARDSTTNKI